MNLNLKKIQYIYNIIQILLTLTFIFLFIYFTQDIFNYCLSLYKSNISADIKIDNLLNYLLSYSIKVISLIVITKIIKTIIAKWNVNSSLLISLDKNKELNTILGRKIAYHLRYNKNLNYEDFIYYIKESNHEIYFLHYHKNSKLNYFLNKYDEHYNSDLN